ncbi:MAG: hypothetical protein WBE20_04085 [Candidatus Acidiferrales bacterium]
MSPGRAKFRKISTVLAALVVIAASAPRGRARATDKIIWKPIGEAILKITGRKPPKAWNVYEDEKDKSRVLVQMDSRCLVVDARTKQVFEIAQTRLQSHGKNLQSSNPEETENALPSTDWDMRDIGPAERIQLRLVKENISLDVELPHPLDLRTAH